MRLCTIEAIVRAVTQSTVSQEKAESYGKVSPAEEPAACRNGESQWLASWPLASQRGTGHSQLWQTSPLLHLHVRGEQ